jgi:NTP pyrophosphatase (non-canonical NTP hydrolase)
MSGEKTKHDLLAQVLETQMASLRTLHASMASDLESVVHAGSASDKLSDLTSLVTTWAKEAFPDRNVHTVIHKLVSEELPEFTVALGRRDFSNIQEESADVMILLLDLWELLGVDINVEVRKKMQVNRVRSWTIDNNGISHHVKDSLAGNVSSTNKSLDGPKAG